MDVATMKKDLENQIGNINKDLKNIYLPHEAVLILLGKRTAFKIALELIDSLQQEQKPAEWDELQSEFKNINEAFEDGKKEVVAHPERYGLCKPAEWSEEDEEILNELLDHCNTENATWYNWLKSLRPQPKQEWSEGDIKKIRSEEYTKGFNDAAFGGKLKEWSEEDEQMFGNILNHYSLIKAPTDGNGISKERYLAFIKSLRPSWKPSEEQMMERTVDGRYMKADGKVYVESWPLDIEPNSVKAGDEVRLIVLPEED